MRYLYSDRTARVFDVYNDHMTICGIFWKRQNGVIAIRCISNVVATYIWVKGMQLILMRTMVNLC